MSNDYQNLYDDEMLPGMRPKNSPKNAIIAVIVVVLVLALGFVIGKNVLYGTGYGITHDSTWETVEGADWRITIPTGLKENTDMQPDPGTVLEGCYRNNEAVVGITSLAMTEDQQKMLANMTGVQKKLIENFPKETDEGIPIEAQQRGRMVYVEYAMNYPGVFFGTDRVEIVDAILMGKTKVWEIQIYVPADKYGDYQEYVYRWLDSFQPSA